MNIKPILITQLAKMILGGHLWDTCRGLVKLLDNTTLTSKQKRAKALDELSVIFSELSEVVLNVGIELAVFWARGQR